jgi:MFS family permease
VVFGAQKMQNTWAWRLPSLIQVVFAVVSIVILPFLPESPRWLIKNGHLKAALEALACTHSNGDENDPIVLAQYRQIIDTMRHEEETHQKANLWETVRTRTNRYRLALALSCAVFAQLCGKSTNVVNPFANQF